MRYWLIPVAAAFTIAVAATKAQVPAAAAGQTPAVTAAQAPAASAPPPGTAPALQPPQAAPVAAPLSTPESRPTPAVKQAAPSGKADKSCIAAGRKLDRERNSLAYAKDETARYTKSSETCATKSTCARYRAALDSLEKRVARHERRIETFTANRDKACKT